MVILKTVWLVILSAVACTANGIILLDILSPLESKEEIPQVQPIDPEGETPQAPIEPDKEIPVLVAVKPDDPLRVDDISEGGYDTEGGVEA